MTLFLRANVNSPSQLFYLQINKKARTTHHNVKVNGHLKSLITGLKRPSEQSTIKNTSILLTIHIPSLLLGFSHIKWPPPYQLSLPEEKVTISVFLAFHHGECIVYLQ